MIADTVGSVLGGSVNPDSPLMSEGLDSLGAVELKNSLEGNLGLPLPSTLMFDYPSVNAITEFVALQVSSTADLDVAESQAVVQPQALVLQRHGTHAASPSGSVVAVMGAACRSPQSAFSQLQGRDAISLVPASRWDVDASAAVDSAVAARFGGWLDGIEMFDAQFFSVSKHEAELMDAQQRVLMESVHDAVLQSGIMPWNVSSSQQQSSISSGGVASQYAGTCVAVGIASAEYNNYVVRRNMDSISAYSATGGALSVASGRLSFLFGFKGPAVSVDTACSSSLVATHFVLSHLLDGTSQCGVAAGVGLLLNPEPTAMFQKAGMLAPDGRCKTLDAAADGYVRSESCGALVLKVVQDGELSAYAGDRSCIALVRSTAVNQDGRSSSLTAPNGPSQQVSAGRKLLRTC